ncbi:putative GTP-binding nuclear protein Ran [Mucor mucedo]|uniref:putative GTP-binding nuclear protein Ran n=1 Tax=Mucor mucedo TaxID=29922 RepID=UPI00221E5EE1|nr:putative GTP-binding nuclear protein Ran [Mucor mucedo]KAI7893743.1 putative GTP-binding nuclear protein Ran [Mucor mucedo]
MADQIPFIFKLILVGDSGTGKTTFIKCHLNGKAEKKDGFVIYSLPFETNFGPVVFNVWDTTGREKAGSLRDDDYHGGHGGIIMFDITSRLTYKRVPQWHRDLARVCENMPIVICGNKVDIKECSVTPRQISYHRRNNLPFYYTSAKSNYNIEKPFLYLAQHLVGEPTLEFINSPVLAPPKIEVDAYLIKQYHEGLAKAATQPLPEYESDSDL